jgi:uncharacterized protein YqeY
MFQGFNMSELKAKLQKDLKDAMIKKDSFKRDTIRFLMSAIKQVEVDERRELSDEDIYKIIQKSIKQREDSITQYREAGREDLAKKEEMEAKLLGEYLPKQLNKDEIREIVKGVIESLNASSMKDMGAVMREANKIIGSRSDGKTVSSVVKEMLTS